MKLSLVASVVVLTACSRSTSQEQAPAPVTAAPSAPVAVPPPSAAPAVSAWYSDDVIAADGGLGPPKTFAFNWKLPCSVPVEERSERAGVAAHLRFSIALKSAGADQIEVRWENMTVVEYGGRTLTPEEAAPVLAMVSALPNLLVTKKGAFVDVTGLDAMIDRMVQGRLIKPDDAQRMHTPEVRAALATGVGSYWQTWVGAWAGLRLGRGQVSDGQARLALGKSQLPARTRVAYMEDTPDGLARLTFVTTMEGSGALDALMGAVGTLAGTPVPADSGVGSLRYLSRMDVQTDPATLRPRRTHYETLMQVTDNGAAKAQREVRDDEFDWTAAKGCLWP